VKTATSIRSLRLNFHVHLNLFWLVLDEGGVTVGDFLGEWKTNWWLTRFEED
jgi:hypothetical protein